ncbi:uncharacterized protein EMH_0003640 [Eimeria mitis]|uniref:SAG family member n=1 Tax=Eimeria mitis TaxID=44415 RepID=U6K0S9_9EIME|nr:uncharacterized protein EMH_0003640 [Eimeria mitis]CDJ29363.1 hypothetical protein EMH_0003640 [Eimeria mitis]
MAPFYKTAAALCLVGLFGLQSAADETPKYAFEIVDVEEDGYLTAKLARNGKISAKTNAVEKDTQLVTELQAKVKTNTQVKEATCSTLVTAELKKFFHHTFNYTDELDYRTLVQQALKTGLDSIGEEYFNELLAREDELKSMTEDDLKDPIVTSSADIAVPSILTAGLVAILAAISA